MSLGVGGNFGFGELTRLDRLAGSCLFSFSWATCLTEFGLGTALKDVVLLERFLRKGPVEIK